jgi:uncharacterized protein YggU (UPF0235/DUF167 family)
MGERFIKVKATPGAKKESWAQLSEDTFAAAVREKAERNLANGRIIELVALHFRVPTKNVRIVTGHRSPSKIIAVTF